MYDQKMMQFLGIIPARAGFTPAQFPAPAGRRDHPRSRGVYGGRPVRRSAPQGSSPLARGLPGLDEGGSDVERIIPARAGFTAPSGRRSPPAWDHPRSRGVYIRLTHPHPRSTGSSPLARGLPWSHHHAGDRGGDHPRSRGVYFGLDPDSPVTGGSSPLARGLPPSRRPPRVRGRIIPARAGFTPSSSPTNRSRPDHPRSRGVYRTGRLAHGDLSGSSPLARGLPVVDRPGRVGGRIIPARAGFT